MTVINKFIYKPQFSIFHGNEDDWNNLLNEKNFHQRQLYFWGEYQRKKASKVIRIIFKDDKEITPLKTFQKIFYFSFFIYARRYSKENFG